MIDVSREELLTPGQVAKLPAFRRRGAPVAVSTVWRWINNGVLVKRSGGGRVKLEHVRLPAGIRSSQEAVERFVAALNTADRSSTPTGANQPAPAPPMASSQGRTRIADELNAIGL